MDEKNSENFCRPHFSPHNNALDTYKQNFQFVFRLCERNWFSFKGLGEWNQIFNWLSLQLGESEVETSIEGGKDRLETCLRFKAADWKISKKLRQSWRIIWKFNEIWNSWMRLNTFPAVFLIDREKHVEYMKICWGKEWRNLTKNLPDFQKWELSTIIPPQPHWICLWLSQDSFHFFIHAHSLAAI
jgi:hypothetical protein